MPNIIGRINDLDEVIKCVIMENYILDEQLSSIVHFIDDIAPFLPMYASFLAAHFLTHLNDANLLPVADDLIINRQLVCEHLLKTIADTLPDQ